MKTRPFSLIRTGLTKVLSLLSDIFTLWWEKREYSYIWKDATNHYRQELSPPHHFDGIFIACQYTRAIEDDIEALKFHGFREYGKRFTEILDNLIKIYPPPWCSPESVILTSTPLSLRRYLERGFNQTELLARWLAKKTGFRYTPLLEKIRHTHHQSRLTRDARITNVRGTYSVKPRIDLTGKTVLLIDDVISTGATFEACALALREAHAEKVYGLFLASWK